MSADVLTWGVVAVGLVALLEALVLVRMSRALAAVTRFGERIGHLASALELLTDTTEAGLTNVARELERTAETRADRSTRGATARRIASATKRGKAPAEIASSEGLSESEVRLHMQLNKAKGGGRGAVRS